MKSITKRETADPFREPHPDSIEKRETATKRELTNSAIDVASLLLGAIDRSNTTYRAVMACDAMCRIRDRRNRQRLMDHMNFFLDLIEEWTEKYGGGKEGTSGKVSKNVSSARSRRSRMPKGGSQRSATRSRYPERYPVVLEDRPIGS